MVKRCSQDIHEHEDVVKAEEGGLSRKVEQGKEYERV